MSSVTTQCKKMQSQDFSGDTVTFILLVLLFCDRSLNTSSTGCSILKKKKSVTVAHTWEMLYLILNSEIYSEVT